jgi:hypothetical protein
MIVISIANLWHHLGTVSLYYCLFTYQYGLVDAKDVMMMQDYALSLIIHCSIESVVEGALDLIADTSKSGAALVVKKDEGLKYAHT